MALIVKSTKKDPPLPLKAVVYGATKAGKTHFAGTFPRPFFFSLASESGISTLSSQEQEAKYVTINSIAEMDEALRLFVETYKKEGYQTAVVDTLTLFGRMVNMELTGDGERAMEFRDWSRFLIKFLNMRNALHSCKVHVVYVCHVNEVKNGDAVTRLEPKLQGQALKEILQTVGLIAYIDKMETEPKLNQTSENQLNAQGEVVPPGGVLVPPQRHHRLWTRCPYGVHPPYEVGSWYDEVLVKGLYKPYFSELAKYLAPHDEKGRPVGQQHIVINP